MSRKFNISIIIVNWNGTEDTIECINSLKNVSYENLNLIVVDNNSDEDQKKRLIEFVNNTDITLILNKDNSGFAGGNNIGIRKALENQSDYILLLNNDTTVDKDFLLPLLKIFESESNCGIVSPIINYYSKPDKVWSAGGKISKIRGSGFAITNIKSQNLSEKIREVSFVSGCCMLIKSEIFHKIGLFDEDFFLYVEDADFCVRTKKEGYRIFVANTSTIYHKVSNSTSIVNSPLPLYYMTRNRLYLVKKHFPKYLIITLSYIFGSMLLKFIYWMFRGKIKNIQLVLLSFKDFFMNKKGKVY
ncbi:MAG: glycosyltransferase family 2 protein [Bacteroidales bacterium]